MLLLDYLIGLMGRKVVLVGLCVMLVMSEVAMAFRPLQKPVPIVAEMYAYFDIVQYDWVQDEYVYRLFVAKPKQVKQPLAVLYLLDGNAHFPLAVNEVDTAKPLPLIVGIGYATDRAYAVEQRMCDYTIAVTGEEFAQGGGAEKFLRFLADEVQPYIQRHYWVDQQKQFFFGHSFGGLFGLYVLFHQADLFQYYTIASPSLWWGKGAIIPQGNQQWVADKVGSILLTWGEYEAYPERNPKQDLERLQRIKRRQLDTIDVPQLAHQLQEQGQQVQFVLLPKANHGEAILPAIQMTLRQIQNEN